MLKNVDSVSPSKKVCIIVPVYNAEKYLGYCLNSILSQTYTNWTAVLVNDGSTDASLEICQNYAAIDSRFRVFSKPNGGVSSARNYGLQFAEGDYLEFLDSDDCLAPDAIEKQVRLATEYNSQLVIMDIMMVDFSDPSLDRVMLSSAWLNQSPCVLSPEEFAEKRMRLIWFTVLLECLHAKLYDRTLWNQLALKFPEDLSLGEDFVVNMKYYEACNNAVFLRECGHYYNCIMGSNSLTQKYRADLFEVKMYLMEKLEEHLGGRHNLSAPELDAYYGYAASSGLVCIEKAVLDSGMEQQTLSARIGEMLSHEIFYESVCNTSYIPDRFCPYLHAFKERDCEKIILGIQGKDIGETNAPEEATPTVCTEPECRIPETENLPSGNPGILNRLIRKIIRSVLPMCKNGTWNERLTRWDAEITEFGLKFVLKKHRQDHKKLTRNIFDRQILALQDQLNRKMWEQQQQTERLLRQVNQFEMSQTQVLRNQTEQIQTLQEQLAAQSDRIHGEVNARVYGVYNRMEERFDAIDRQTSDQMNAFSAALDSMAQVISDEFQTQSAVTSRKITESSEYLKNEITGHTWLAEQRMLNYAYQRDINELRQKKKAIMIATAEHSNIGDAAITLAEQLFLQQYFPDYYQVEISTYEFRQKEAYLHVIVNPEDIIFINGGGNIGDMYPAEEALHRSIVEMFPNNKIIILPQTISFSSTEAGAKELAESAKVYNRHGDLTLYVRGEESLRFARKHFANVQTSLMPDMVHILRTDYLFDREGALLCLREDEEGILSTEQKQKIVFEVLSQVSSIATTNNMYKTDITRDIRGKVVREELMRFAKHRVVITDRLHGMIFAAVTGTPCVVLASCNQKIREYYHAFFRDSNAIFFVDDHIEDVFEAVQQALAVSDVQYPVLEQNPHAAIRQNVD